MHTHAHAHARAVRDSKTAIALSRLGGCTWTLDSGPWSHRVSQKIGGARRWAGGGVVAWILLLPQVSKVLSIALQARA